MGRKSNTKLADEALEGFHRQTHCWLCQDHPKESLVFHGKVIYYCPNHGTFQHYKDIAGEYWRRKREQSQN